MHFYKSNDPDLVAKVKQYFVEKKAFSKVCEEIRRDAQGAFNKPATVFVTYCGDGYTCFSHIAFNRINSPFFTKYPLTKQQLKEKRPKGESFEAYHAIKTQLAELGNKAKGIKHSFGAIFTPFLPYKTFPLHGFLFFVLHSYVYVEWRHEEEMQALETISETEFNQAKAIAERDND